MHNLCTQEVKGLADGTGREAFFTNVKGRCMGHGYLYSAGEFHCIIGVANQGAKLVPHVDRYVITEDAQFVDESESYAGIAFTGESATKIAEQVHQTFLSSPSLSYAPVQWQSVNVECAQVNWNGASGMLLIVRRDDQTKIAEALKDNGWQATDECERFEAARITAGWPWYGRDFSDENLPQELHRNDAAISFVKGCYLGQETVARLDALGQVQKRMARWRFESSHPIPLGTELWINEKSIAKVTSTALCPLTGKTVALAMTRRGSFEVGTKAKTQEGIQAEVFE